MEIKELMKKNFRKNLKNQKIYFIFFQENSQKIKKIKNLFIKR